MLLQKSTKTHRFIQNLAALSLSSLLTCSPSTTASLFTLSCSITQKNFQPKEKKVSSRGCNRDSALDRGTTRGIRFLSRFSNDLTLTVDEYDGLYPNTLFQAAESETYLSSVITPDTKRFRASKPEREKQIKVSMEKDKELTDWFGEVQIKWRLFCKDTPEKYIANRTRWVTDMAW